VIEPVLWVALLGTVALPVRAAWARSPALMWAGALCSLAVSIAGMYSIGALVFLLACLELGSAVAMRWGANGRGWAACLLAALLVWVVVVPVQVAGAVWLPWVAAFPLVVVIGSLALLAQPPAWAAPRAER
jgi:hypothetical protein